MKVKELIEQLQQLNPEKDIWVVYDCIYPKIPSFDELEEDDIMWKDGAKVGDYAHKAW